MRMEREGKGKGRRGKRKKEKRRWKGEEGFASVNQKRDRRL